MFFFYTSMLGNKFFVWAFDLRCNFFRNIDYNVLPSYWLICYCIEKHFRKKKRIQGWCRYRLNKYFIIKKKYRGKAYIYMNMTLPLTLINWWYCIRKRRYAILKEFSHALTDLKSMNVNKATFIMQLTSLNKSAKLKL